MHDARVVLSKSANVSGRLFSVGRSNYFHNGRDQVVSGIKIGSCRLQEEQML
jgi:hypothetical protein